MLWRVFHGRYRSEQDLYRAAYDLPWPDWFSPRDTIKVKVSAQQCPLRSLEFVTLKIKDELSGWCPRQPRCRRIAVRARRSESSKSWHS